MTRRIIAVSLDEHVGRQLATTLRAAGAEVELYRHLAAVTTSDPPSLCIVQVAGAADAIGQELGARLPGRFPVIAILPASNLAAALELMQTSDRVAGVFGADTLDIERVAVLAKRVLDPGGFGLTAVLATGSRLHTLDVADHDDKLHCLARVAAFVDELGVSHGQRASIEQCLDEMLMNALYDAPTDGRGRHVFAGVGTRARIQRRTAQQVSVQYGADRRQLAIAVRDVFGSLERGTLLRHLYKGLHAKDKIDRKAGGAGLGLYLMANAASAVSFTVARGAATEAVCVFDLTTPGRLGQLDYIEVDARGRPAAPAARAMRTPAARRRLAVRAVAATAAVAIGALAVLAGPRPLGRPTARIAFVTEPTNATVEIDGMRLAPTAGQRVARDLELGRPYRVAVHLAGYEPKQMIVTPSAQPATMKIALDPVAILELSSQPADAAVEVDGVKMGSTPLTLTSLAPGSTVSITFDKLGYRRSAARVQVPNRGVRKQVVQALDLSDEYVRVRFESNPPGAAITREGAVPSAERTYTPADVFVEANRPVRYTLTMPGHVPLQIDVVAERGAHGIVKSGDLVAGSRVRFEASRPGKLTVVGAAHCRERPLPVDCTLAPGNYEVEYSGEGAAKVMRNVTVGDSDILEKF